MNNISIKIKGDYILDNITTSVVVAFFTSLSTKGAEAPAKTLDNLWKYIFGPLDNYLIKHNAQREHNLNQFIKKINDNCEKIEPQNIQEPKISILGPALESSKYYIDEEIIRELFAKVISATFDKSKNSILHHSFVEIIKQLSPLDAKIIKAIPNDFYLIACKDNDQNIIFSNVFLYKPFSEINLETSISTSNLCRLGLITVQNNFGNVLIGGNHQETINKYLVTEHYKNSCNHYGQANLYPFTQPGNITPLGIAFKSICCSDN